MLMLPVVAQSGVPTVELEPAGMVVMTLSVLLVCGLTIYCAVKILGDKSPSEHHHAPLDIDTRDTER